MDAIAKIASLILIAALGGVIVLSLGIRQCVTANRSATGQQQPAAPSSVGAIRSLGYAAWHEIDDKDRTKIGVTLHDAGAAYEGVNLFHSENTTGGYLLDMQGNVLHVFHDLADDTAKWKLIEPYRGERFLVLIEDVGFGRSGQLSMIDWHSNIEWTIVGHFHHDVAVAGNGDIYTIENHRTSFPAFSSSLAILDNRLFILTKDGKTRKTLSFAEMVSEHPALLDAARGQKAIHIGVYGPDAWDVFHTNTLEIIERRASPRSAPVFQEGRVLFCMRHMNIIGVIDLQAERIIWYWGLDHLEQPHHPTLLGNGNVLIFDNGVNRKFSRIIELNPVTEAIEWEYRADPPESFYSKTRGSAQRLPNGNTLIAESDEGRAFEITRDGSVVWEFYNPELNKKRDKRATLYRFRRFVDADDFVTGFPTGAKGALDVISRHRKLAIAFLREGRLREAAGEFRTLLQWLPDDPRVHDRLGLIHLKQGQLELAI